MVILFLPNVCIYFVADGELVAKYGAVKLPEETERDLLTAAGEVEAVVNRNLSGHEGGERTTVPQSGKHRPLHTELASGEYPFQETVEA
jgi:hypothetical protein